MNKEWHTASTGNHQGLVIDQAGNNIAVAYDKQDAPLIAAAPELLDALKNAVVLVFAIANRQRQTSVDVAQAKACLPHIHNAIAKATEPPPPNR